ncbi:PPK2 family polyphosphate kinase [Motilibacter aurantiacus]|uniref:PPK2 family polyphosphate kinase n=1 Tax=Motilibacter aurantiacus TaxID=2714955 RepID=UPI00140B144E|nr:PPK2 family polyphosphate kinase [Motilibacter aurantiacus]NHC46105.1 polyphosphate kinase 2 family protein [Motilibacter aurantiacus]
MAKHTKTPAPSVSELLRLPPGERVDLAATDTRATPGISGGKGAAGAAQQELAERLAELQERLYASGRTGGERRLLLVLQGMDTSGKGGTVRHVLGQVDPQGVSITAFARPTEEELHHDFLWRVERRLPPAGAIGVFDRSHYEDVVAARVRGSVPQSTWGPRFDIINRWEEQLVERGLTLLKVFLHISPEESRRRLLARLDTPEKHWKFSPDDIDDWGRWDAYTEAYEDALRRCGTRTAPWFVVPADRKWYRNWAVTALLVEHLDGLGLGWPPATFDVAAERARLLAAG